jgi:hypothetical protein
MRTTIKIVILVQVILMATAAVLIFYPTIVSPPQEVTVEDLHMASLDDNLQYFSDSRSYASNDSVYNVVIDKLALYETEGFMSEKVIDDKTKALVAAYVPVFKTLCNRKFQSSVWYESDHTSILQRIKHLRSLKVDNNKVAAVSGTYASDLQGVEKVISDYRTAKKVAAYSSFISIDDARAKIDEANRYMNTPPIKNCEALTDKLSDVKANIGESHYRHLVSEVSRLNGYRNMTESAFMDLYRNVMTQIREYDSNKSMYGYNASSTDYLKEVAEEYYDDAEAYYSDKSIDIYSNYEWESISSPHSSYRAYRSYYNHNRHSTNARMSFTIKGYREFTFYIRSNGESGCDYVIVGKDYIPNTSNYDASTYNKATSGSSFSYYSPVRYTNLDPSREYTINVVYRKDGSVNNGDDRGYVLIPYESN